MFMTFSEFYDKCILFVWLDSLLCGTDICIEISREMWNPSKIDCLYKYIRQITFCMCNSSTTREQATENTGTHEELAEIIGVSYLFVQKEKGLHSLNSKESEEF